MVRRTVWAEGLTRFIAACLLAGYAWLLLGGGLALYFGNTGAGFIYDATLHAVFVGFVFSMIFGHAPVIFPSVLGISIPYRPFFYVHVVLLYVSLLFRVGEGPDVRRVASPKGGATHSPSSSFWGPLSPACYEPPQTLGGKSNR